jgi:hypothetical protein
MRRLLVTLMAGTILAPAAALSQVPPPAAEYEGSGPVLGDPAPPPTPTAELPAPPESAPAAGDPAPPPAEVAPVDVEGGKDKKKPLITKRDVGGVAGGAIGGIAGAAVLGPVGKFVGAFVGKQVAKTVMGKPKADDPPKQEVAAAAPSAESAAAPAVASPATAPPLEAPLIDAPPADAPPEADPG